jgi:hypothetical protein
MLDGIYKLAYSHGLNINTFVILYLFSFIPVYGGAFLIIYGSAKRLKIKDILKLKFNAQDINNPTTRAGLLVFIFGWLLPYLYLLIFGRNIPPYAYLLLLALIIIPLYLVGTKVYLKNNNKTLITRIK